MSDFISRNTLLDYLKKCETFTLKNNETSTDLIMDWKQKGGVRGWYEGG